LVTGVVDGALIIGTYESFGALTPVTVAYFTDGRPVLMRTEKAALMATAIVVGHVADVTATTISNGAHGVVKDIEYTGQQLMEILTLPERDPAAFMRLWYP
jgi:NO-binding membrane sensor protein with MHYT domain